MAAYAALVSLMNTVEQIQTDRRYSVSLDNKQIESLGEKVAFLEHFVETHSNGGGPEAEALERQTLIITSEDTHHFPSHLIWQMPKLRHLKIYHQFTSHEGFSLPDPPPPQSDQQDAIVLQNLQTLQRVCNLKLSEEVCIRIPNLKKLKMVFDKPNADHYCLYNLHRLHKLESLNCNYYRGRGDLQKLTLPTSLKKLTLAWANLRSENLRRIGRLPHLEVLVIWVSHVVSDWNPVEGGFCRLKFLQIGIFQLEEWNADRSHFPLRLIHLDRCSGSIAMSAVRILEEQESLGNEDLQVKVEFLNEDELKRFRERMEDEVGSFTSNNLHLKAWD